MIRAVLDTNILASGFLTVVTPPGQLIDAWLADQFELITSAVILREVQRTLAKPYFAARLTPGQVARAQTLLQTRATLTPLTLLVQGMATHPADDLILSTALSGRTRFLVTGDERFRRRVPSYQGVTLISPRDFLSVLQS